MGSKKKANLKSVPMDLDEEIEPTDEFEDAGEMEMGEAEEEEVDLPDDAEDTPAPEEEEDPPPKKVAKKPKAAAPEKKPKAAKAKAVKKEATPNAIEVDKYEYELGGEILSFTKRRALALSMYIESSGKADPADVAAAMAEQYGEPKKGTHLASARRVRGLYLKLMEAEVIK